MRHGGDKEGVKNGWNDAHPICLMSFLIVAVCPKTKSQPQDQGRQGHQPLQMMRIEKPFDQHPCRKMQGENGGHEVPWTGVLQPAHCCAEKMDGDFRGGSEHATLCRLLKSGVFVSLQKNSWQRAVFVTNCTLQRIPFSAQGSKGFMTASKSPFENTCSRSAARADA